MVLFHLTLPSLQVAAVEACSGKTPIVTGKPSSFLVDLLVRKHNLKREDICMVGDRLDTDILFGKGNGMVTLLTMGGVTDAQQLASAEPAQTPDYVMDSVADLIF